MKFDGKDVVDDWYEDGGDFFFWKWWGECGYVENMWNYEVSSEGYISLLIDIEVSVLNMMFMYFVEYFKSFGWVIVFFKLNLYFFWR